MINPLTIAQSAKSYGDIQEENTVNNLRKAQVLEQLRKSKEVDADKLGEQAFLKAAQGIPLSPQELAAFKFIDAKSGGIQFDPATGGVIQKPRLSEKINVPGIDQGSPMGTPSLRETASYLPPMNAPTSADAPLPSFDPATGSSPPNEFEAKFQTELRAAAGNPKLQQSIRENYAKAKTTFTEDQAKAAGFADRMALSNPVFDKTAAAATDPLQQALSSIPLAGNYLVSDDYQKFDQARKDFTNAQLRRESGAAINKDEFKNAESQYLPKPGDSEEVLAQKALNRQTSREGMSRSAGASYIPKPTNLFDKSEADFNAKRSSASPIKRGATATNPQTGERLMFDGNSWKKIK